MIKKKFKIILLSFFKAKYKSVHILRSRFCSKNVLILDYKFLEDVPKNVVIWAVGIGDVVGRDVFFFTSCLSWLFKFYRNHGMYYLYDKKKKKIFYCCVGRGLRRGNRALCVHSQKHAWKGMGVPFRCVMSTWGEVVEGKVSRSETRSRPFSISWYSAPCLTHNGVRYTFEEWMAGSVNVQSNLMKCPNQTKQLKLARK